MNPDRNDPETVSYLDLCRSWRPELSTEEFEELIPEFIELADRLLQLKEMKLLH